MHRQDPAVGAGCELLGLGDWRILRILCNEAACRTPEKSSVLPCFGGMPSLLSEGREYLQIRARGRHGRASTMFVPCSLNPKP